jgi:Domain of unknown function (DUF4328)
MATAWRAHLRSMSRRRLQTVLVTLLVLDAIVAWAVVLGVYTFVDRVWRGLASRTPAAGTLGTHLFQLEAVRLVQGIMWILTAIVFLGWVSRAHGALRVLGVRGLRFTAPSVTAAFLVPVLNVVTPVWVVSELWNASDNGWAPGSPWREAPTPPIVWWWWGVFLAACVLDPVWRPLLGGVEDIVIGGGTSMLVLAQLGAIAAAVLAIVIVKTVEGRQRRGLDARDA